MKVWYGILKKSPTRAPSKKRTNNRKKKKLISCFNGVGIKVSMLLLKLWLRGPFSTFG